MTPENNDLPEEEGQSPDYIEQSELDALLSQLGESADEPEEKPEETGGQPEEDYEGLDAVIGEDEAPPQDEDAVALDQDDISSLLSELDAEVTPDSDDMGAEVEEPVPAVEQEEPEPIAGMEELGAGEDEPAEDGAGEEAPEISLDDAGRAEAPDSLEDALSDLGLEDETEPTATQAPARAPGSVEPALGEGLGDGEPAPARSKGAAARLIERNLGKFAIAVSAGVIALLAVGAYLYVNRAKPPGEAFLERARTGDLETAAQQARVLMDDGFYGQAQELLESALAQAPVRPSEVRLDAEFLLAEAAYREAEAEGGAAVDSALMTLDAVLERTPGGVRTPEALVWKARLYEEEDTPRAARTFYNEALMGYQEFPGRADALLAAAENALELGLADEALSHLRNLTEYYPGTEAAGRGRLLRGDAHLAEGDAQPARRIWERLAGPDQPDDVLRAQAVARLAKLNLDEGDYATAIAQLEDRAYNAPTPEGNDRLMLLLAKAHAAAGDPEESERVLRDLIDVFPRSPVLPEAFAELCRVLEARGETSEAARLAGRAASRYPDNPDVLRMHARLLAETGETATATEAIEAAAEAGALEPTLLLDTGRDLREAGELDQAAEALGRLVADFPRAPEAFLGSIELALTEYEQGQVRAAVRRLKDLALISEGRPSRLPVLNALATVYEDLGLHGEAAEIHQQIAAVSTDPEMLAKAALALMKGGKQTLGLEVASRVELDLVPDDLAYRLLVEQGRQLMGAQPVRALDRLEQAHVGRPSERTADGELALLKAYITADRWAMARSFVMDLAAHVRRHPVDAPRLIQAAVTWGDALYARGDYRAAADAYALAGDPAFPMNEERRWARYQRANALFETGDYEGSIELFDSIASGESSWAPHAAARARVARVRQRLMDEPVTPLPETGA